MFPAGDNSAVHPLFIKSNGQRKAQIPVGRFCRTEEVAATTLLMVENGYITGKIYLRNFSFPFGTNSTVDGGMFPH